MFKQVNNEERVKFINRNEELVFGNVEENTILSVSTKNHILLEEETDDLPTTSSSRISSYKSNKKPDEKLTSSQSFANTDNGKYIIMKVLINIITSE